MKILSLIFIALLTLPASAQPGADAFSFGLTANFNRSIHLYNRLACFTSTETSTQTPYLTNGVDNGFSVGLSAEQPLMIDLWDISIIGKLSFESLPASSDILINSTPTLVEEVSEAGDTTYSIGFKNGGILSDHLDYYLFSRELLFKINLFNSHLGLIAGPTLGYMVYNHYISKYQLFEPINGQFIRGKWDSVGCRIEPIRYEDNDRTMIYADEPATGLNKFRVGLILGLQYEIIFPGMKIVPFISYNAGLTELTAVWKVNAFKIGLDARIIF